MSVMSLCFYGTKPQRFEFDQYFSVTGCADFGLKIIKVKGTENGAKIFYEELKSSTLVTDSGFHLETCRK